MQIHSFFFASELDGALLPNGILTATPGCLERTRELLEQLKAANYPVAYVTDHYLELAKENQKLFKLPEPDHWICNLGTEIRDTSGRLDDNWKDMMGPTLDKKQLLSVLKGNPNLVAHEDETQGAHKFSFYYTESVDDNVRNWMLGRVRSMIEGIRLMDTIEESSGLVVLHLVPKTAGKANALGYLAEKLGLPRTRVFFSGNSEGDLEALTSGICGTLVGNTPRATRDRAREVAENTEGARLTLSRSYYGDGVIEGLQAYNLVR
uniref:Hydroxymethylpyrimidine pyrophosphatase n=1 Tax=Candidatus Kentrum sp. FW TaxID=2126338 RepID=A0A450TYZ7_9GAMM|nr:MAG: Hydroxymethylpyrimidine pyrophosphatase [Candidatus Kentron sp. FW]